MPLRVKMTTGILNVGIQFQKGIRVLKLEGKKPYRAEC